MKPDYSQRITSSEAEGLLKELKSRLVLDQSNVRAYLKLKELSKSNAVNKLQYKLIDPDVFQVFTKSTITKIGFQELNLAGNKLRFIDQDGVFNGLIYFRKINLLNNKLE